MDEREMTIELIAQTLAPRLFALFGTPPEEMGFPIYDTKEEVEVHLARQFSPVEYWTEEGRKIGNTVANILAAGGVAMPKVTDEMCQAAMRERTDIPSPSAPSE